MSAAMTKRLFDVTTLLLVIIGTVALAWGLIKHPTGVSHDDGMELVVQASDLHDIVADADVIIVGEIDSIVDGGLYEGYSGASFLEVQTPTPPVGMTPTAPPFGAIPFVDLRIDEEAVIKNDESNEGRILRMAVPSLQDTSTYCAGNQGNYPPGNIGERYMFFLRQNPDGSYGLASGPYDRVVLGEEITYSDCDETAVDFATGMDEGEFVEAVETQVAAPTRTPTNTRTPTATRTPTPTPCFGPGC